MKIKNLLSKLKTPEKSFRLKDSGMVVNESKTELCLFHRNDKPKITVCIGGCLVISKNQINVLGVTFDSKLNWTTHVNNCIVKAKKALYGLRLLRRYFNATQMRMLLDSKFYSILVKVGVMNKFVN